MQQSCVHFVCCQPSISVDLKHCCWGTAAQRSKHCWHWQLQVRCRATEHTRILPFLPLQWLTLRCGRNRLPLLLLLLLLLPVLLLRPATRGSGNGSGVGWQTSQTATTAHSKLALPAAAALCNCDRCRDPGSAAAGCRGCLLRLDLLHCCLNCMPGLQPRAWPLQAISAAVCRRCCSTLLPQPARQRYRESHEGILVGIHRQCARNESQTVHWAGRLVRVTHFVELRSGAMRDHPRTPIVLWAALDMLGIDTAIARALQRATG